MVPLVINRRRVERDRVTGNLCRYRFLHSVLAACVFYVIVIRHFATESAEPDVKMNDGGDDPIYGELVLIATTNRQTGANPFPRRERRAKRESYLLHFTPH